MVQVGFDRGLERGSGHERNRKLEGARPRVETALVGSDVSTRCEQCLDEGERPSGREIEGSRNRPRTLAVAAPWHLPRRSKMVSLTRCKL